MTETCINSTGVGGFTRSQATTCRMGSPTLDFTLVLIELTGYDGVTGTSRNRRKGNIFFFKSNRCIKAFYLKYNFFNINTIESVQH